MPSPKIGDTQQWRSSREYMHDRTLEMDRERLMTSRVIRQCWLHDSMSWTLSGWLAGVPFDLSREQAGAISKLEKVPW